MREQINIFFCCSIFLLNAGGRRLQLWRDPARSLHTAHAETLLLLLMMSWKASQMKGHRGRGGWEHFFVPQLSAEPSGSRPSARRGGGRAELPGRRPGVRLTHSEPPGGSCGERRPSFARLIKLDVKRSYGTRLLFLVFAALLSAAENICEVSLC